MTTLLATGKQQGNSLVQMCRLLEIDPTEVNSITLKFERNALVVAVIERTVTKNELERVEMLLGCMEKPPLA